FSLHPPLSQSPRHDVPLGIRGRLRQRHAGANVLGWYRSLDDSSLFDPVEPVDVFPKTLALQAFHELRHGVMLSVVRRVENEILAAAPRAGPYKLVLRL